MLVFIDQVVEIFIDTSILLVAEVVETFIEYGAELVDDIKEEADEMFF